MEQFLATDDAATAADTETLQLQLKESAVRHNISAHLTSAQLARNTAAYLLTLNEPVMSTHRCCMFDGSQGVLEDIATLQLNVTSVNTTCDALLEHCTPAYRDTLQRDVSTMNDRSHNPH